MSFMMGVFWGLRVHSPCTDTNSRVVAGCITSRTAGQFCHLLCCISYKLCSWFCALCRPGLLVRSIGLGLHRSAWMFDSYLEAETTCKVQKSCQHML